MELLHILSVISLITGGLCAIIIVFDIVKGNYQRMMIMNFVYPLTALYSGPIGLLFYYTIGKMSVVKNEMVPIEHDSVPKKKRPMWQQVAIGTLHCGSGCTLGDIMAETLLLFVPVSIFESKLAGSWIIDFAFAFAIGIAFEYYAIKPMKDISVKAALKASFKADVLSLTSWQIGMYGWMAIAFFLIFGHKLEANNPLFWFMMQAAMLCGFITAYPINWWLLKKGVKEVM